MSIQFEMTIKDVFYFQDKRTVFVGEVIDGPKYIRSCVCDLYVGHTKKTTIRIEGEMIANPAHHPTMRSVSTTEAVTLNRDEIENVGCRLLFNHPI